MDRRQAAQLEWMRRNYALLTPEHRAIVDAAYGSPAKDPNRSTAEVSFGDDAPNVASDLDASATPMPAEPVLQPGRKRSRADWAVDATTAGGLYSPSENVDAMRVGDKPSLSATMRSANTLASPEAFDAAFNANGNHYPSAVSAFTQQLIASGVAPEYAQRAARARAAAHSAPYTRDVYADEMAATEDPSQMYPGYRSASAGTPSPATTGALPDADPRTTRAERLAGVDATSARWDRQKAAYDRDTGLSTLNEGYVDEEGPYPGAGRPGYDRTLTFDEVMASREQAEAERAARMRPMLDADKRDMKAREQWRADNPAEAESLAVGQRERSEDYRKERLLYRMAEQTGMSIEELRANNPQFSSVGQIPSRDGAGIPTLTRTKDGMQLRNMPTSTSSMRDAAAAQRIADKKARAETWKAQAMLAGGQPTGGPRGTKALTNALLMIDDPEAQRRSLQYMLPGGALSAQVDARQLDMAAGLAQRALTGALAGTAQGPLAQAQAEMAQLQAQAERDKLRAQDEDILGDKYAKGGWLGYDEFTIAEQQQMYDDLVAQGYRPGEAQRAVDRQASKRRASQRQQWNP